MVAAFEPHRRVNNTLVRYALEYEIRALRITQDTLVAELQALREKGAKALLRALAADLRIVRSENRENPGYGTDIEMIYPEDLCMPKTV